MSQREHCFGQEQEQSGCSKRADPMDGILGTVHWNTTGASRWTLDTLSAYYGILALTLRTYCAFEVIQGVYYPILAIVGAPGKYRSIVIPQTKC